MLEIRTLSRYSENQIGGKNMKTKILGLLTVGMLVLTGCSIGASTEKQLSDTLTKMNDSESAYRSAQTKLTELEQHEQNTFTETMELTKDDVDQLRTKVDELKQLNDERLTNLDEEEKAMNEAKAFTGELDDIKEKAPDSEKQQIQKLQDAVSERYDLHTTFISEYKKLTSIQKEFYGMLSKEDVELEELKERVQEVNAQNEVVQATITKFNEATKKVNEVKESIFKSLSKEE